MLQGALVRIAAYPLVLILVHKASEEATIRRRPPKRRRRLASVEASAASNEAPACIRRCACRICGAASLTAAGLSLTAFFRFSGSLSFCGASSLTAAGLSLTAIVRFSGSLSFCGAMPHRCGAAILPSGGWQASPLSSGSCRSRHGVSSKTLQETRFLYIHIYIYTYFFASARSMLCAEPSFLVH